jgi:trehalose 6-phosphate synthase
MGEADLVVASNRGPLSFSIDGDGHPVSVGSAGGLAAALQPLLEGTGASWVACALSDADRMAKARGLVTLDGVDMFMVEPDPATYRMAYDVVANSTLWFCHHHLFDLTRRPRFDRFWAEAWEQYRELNRAFAAVVREIASPGATVLVQDYHLCLLPGMLAVEREDLRSVHFTHTPFADPNVLRVLPAPAARELLRGMSAAAWAGFHTTRWESAFLACCADNDVDPPRTFVSPLSPDPAYLAKRAVSPRCLEAGERLDALIGDRQVVLSVDRVEPSKNLLRAFWSFDELMHRHPELRGKVVLLSLTYESRQSLPEYLAYATEIEHTAQWLNGTWGTDDWTPVLFEMADDPDRSFAALKRYDVLLVNPLRDGLNLVAKEGPLLNTTDGVLALSREAGSFAELRDEAIELNPFDVTGTAQALAHALTMAPEERRRRARSLRALVARRKPDRWLTDQTALAGRGG